MTTKDRLDELRARSSQLEDKVDFPIRFEDHWINDAEEPLLPLYTQDEWTELESFLAIVEQTQRHISLLESYVEDVTMKHSQLLISPHEDQKTKQELNSVMTAFTQLSDSVRSTLKQMKKESENIKSERKARDDSFEHAIDIRIRSCQEAGLNRRLVAVLQNYNAEQAKYKEKCQSRIQEYLQLTGRSVDQEEIDDMIESGNLTKHVNSLFLEERKAKEVLLELEARHEDIRRLETNVRELHQIFLHTAMLIEEQGDKIDRIEYNVQNTVDVTQRARIRLNAAQRFQSKYRRKKLYCVIIAVVGSIILLAIIISSVCATTSIC